VRKKKQPVQGVCACTRTGSSASAMLQIIHLHPILLMARQKTNPTTQTLSRIVSPHRLPVPDQRPL
jgi:hypothetical protein